VARELLRGGSGPARFDPPRVAVLDNLENGAEANLAEFAGDPRLAEFVVGDIADRRLIARLFAQHRFDLVLHLAAKINVQESIDRPVGVFEADVAGTFHLLEATRQAGAAFAFMSTCMVYSPSAAPTGIAEDHPTFCASPYAAAKRAAECLVESYGRAYGMRTVVLRPFNTYGPFQKSSGEGGVVSIFLHRDLTGGILEIYGDGSQTRDLLYVEDCASFSVAAALADQAIGRTLNAGTGRDVTINELAAAICADPARIKHVPHIHPQAEIPKLLADVRLAARLLNWRPLTALERGIDETRKWLKNRI
jgi:nucleoside-diphosphate-sugar epimerase